MSCALQRWFSLIDQTSESVSDQRSQHKNTLSSFGRTTFHLVSAYLVRIDGFHSRDLYIKVNYFKGVATQENNNSDSKRIPCLISLFMALFCDHTSMQLFTATNKDECALP